MLLLLVYALIQSDLRVQIAKVSIRRRDAFIKYLWLTGGESLISRNSLTSE